MHPDELTATPGRRLAVFPAADPGERRVMNVLGVRLNLLIGRAPTALPASPAVLEPLASVEVTQSDRGPSGFGSSSPSAAPEPLDALDYRLVLDPLLQVNSRVVMTVIFDITPRVIMDGLVTRRDVVPGDRPGEGRLVLTGHDLSVASITRGQKGQLTPPRTRP